MASNFLKQLGMSRECLSFETGTPKVDAAIICHEVRCFDLREHERVCLSYRNLAKRGSEEFAMPGEVAQLFGVQLDSTVLVTVFATSEESSAVAMGEKRPLGELRIPLHRVVTRCDGALYHTWFTLDTASLQDTASSITSLIAGGDAEAFDRSMLNGPRQLAQPKACISICKTSVLDAAGRVLYVADAPNDFRIAQWGPLLRSQQQHVVMCAAYHLESTQQPVTSPSQNAMADRMAARLQMLEEKESESMQEIARLRSEAQTFRDRDSKQLSEIQRLQADVARYEANAPQAAVASAQQQSAMEAQAAEIQHLKQLLAGKESERREALEAAAAAASSTSRQETEHLQSELTKMSAEANAKIDAANERIRSLRRDRDEALREAERVAAEKRQLQQDKNALLLEKDQLTEQKEALLKIVEDLHQTCIGAGQQGLQGATRASIDSITGLRLS